MNEFENAWHNVRGIDNAEMRRNAVLAEQKYGDIINMEHPVSKVHPRLSRESRAAQFSPFAALTGLEKRMEEAAENTRELFENDTLRVSFDELMKPPEDIDPDEDV